MVERVEILLSLVESLIELKYFHDVATSYAIKNQLVASKAPSRGSSLVLYGIRELA